MRDKYKPSEKEIEMFRRMTSGKSKKELLKLLKNAVHAYMVIKRQEKEVMEKEVMEKEVDVQ